MQIKKEKSFGKIVLNEHHETNEMLNSKKISTKDQITLSHSKNEISSIKVAIIIFKCFDETILEC